MACSSCNCNPCTCSCSCDPANEALESAFNNFTADFIGLITKTCVNGSVVWTLPCDLDGEFTGFAKGAGESILCYWQRAIQNALTNIPSFPVSIANGGTGATDAAGARINLGLEIGVDVQAWDTQLDTWATVIPAAGIATFLATPTSANLAAAVTNETGSGLLVFGTSPALITPTITNAANTAQVLTDAATIAWDADLGAVASVALGANRAMGLPTNLRVGTYILKTTGAFSITSWNAIFQWSAGTPPVAAGTKNVYSFFYDGTNLIGGGVVNIS